MIERAKGILMAIHGVDEQEAFEILRSHSQHNGRKLIDLAEAVVESHRLLAPKLEAPKNSV
jgi:AmiR/NasT family two-component response regulator